MLDFIERFFKLTLDNVYRFACSLIFILSLAGLWSHEQPLAMFQELMSWLGFRSSSWVAAVADWIDVRAAVIGLLANIMLFVSLAFAAANRLGGRAGATAILMVALMIQTDTLEGPAVIRHGHRPVPAAPVDTGLAAEQEVPLGVPDDVGERVGGPRAHASRSLRRSPLVALPAGLAHLGRSRRTIRQRDVQ